MNEAACKPVSEPVIPIPKIRTVAVIGAGVAGRSFAMACAAAGFHVVLEDVMPVNLRKAEAEYADASLRGGYGSLELASDCGRRSPRGRCGRGLRAG